MALRLDPALCREHLQRLLNEEETLLGEFEALLTGEHGTLVANDLEALERSCDARQKRVGALLRIQDERQQLLRLLNYSTDAAGIDQMLNWCDPNQSLRQRWAACADLAARCRTLNDQNGALVMARMQRVQGMLGALTGDRSHAALYDARGARADSTQGRMLAAQA